MLIYQLMKKEIYQRALKLGSYKLSSPSVPHKIHKLQILFGAEDYKPLQIFTDPTKTSSCKTFDRLHDER